MRGTLVGLTKIGFVVSVNLPETRPILQSGPWETGKGGRHRHELWSSTRASRQTITEGAAKGAERRFSNRAPPR